MNFSLSTAYTVSGLNRGKVYGFRYRAVNINGAGGWSAVEFITAATIPSAPNKAPVYASSTDSQIELVLTRSIDDGGVAIINY